MGSVTARRGWGDLMATEEFQFRQGGKQLRLNLLLIALALGSLLTFERRRRRRYLRFFLLFLAAGICVYAQTNEAASSNPPSEPVIPAALTPPCSPLPTYRPPPNPDEIDLALNKERKRYRLVIGAGKFSQSQGMDRNFVAPTAADVDQALDQVGFSPLPSLPKDHPYLADEGATKQAVNDALKTMAQVMSDKDYGVVYYVGHGMIAPSNKDVSLAVYDRPVEADEGIRVSDLLGELEVGEWRSDITEIPHFLIVLDACYSGNATLGSQPLLITTKNVQRVVSGDNQSVPDNIAIMSATSDGDSSSAYELLGTGESAFGFYFARALEEQWPCADLEPDGILTLSELKDYLTLKLRNAGGGIAGKKYTEATMVPRLLTSNNNDHAFIAYSATHYSIDGVRDLVTDIEIEPALGQVAEVILPSGTQLTCGGANALPLASTCTAQVSRKSVGNIAVASMPAADYAAKLNVAAQALQVQAQQAAAQAQQQQTLAEQVQAQQAAAAPALQAEAQQPQTKHALKLQALAQQAMAEQVQELQALARQAVGAAQQLQVQAQRAVTTANQVEQHAEAAKYKGTRKQGSVSFADLLSRKQTVVAGVTLKVK